MRVEDVMTRKVHSVRPQSTLKDVASVLSAYGIGGMPVVDDRRRPVGVISKTDIVIKEHAELPRRGLSRMFRSDGDIASKVNAKTAGEAMSAPAITIIPIMPLSFAAERMLSDGVNRLPVVEGETLVGIVTRHDLVRAFGRSDDELEREIRDDALSDLSWPGALDLSVDRGQVTISGQVDSPGEARSLPRQIRHVFGVVSVDSELTAWDPQSERKVAISTHL